MVVKKDVCDVKIPVLPHFDQIENNNWVILGFMLKVHLILKKKNMNTDFSGVISESEKTPQL